MHAATTTLDEIVIFRTNAQLDRECICGFWLPGLRYGNSWFKKIDNDAYWNTYPLVVNRILDRPLVTISTAVLRRDPDAVVGFAVMEAREGAPAVPRTLHWVWTRERWRARGIARRLVAPTIEQVSHLTKRGLELKPKAWKFNPFV